MKRKAISLLLQSVLLAVATAWHPTMAQTSEAQAAVKALTSKPAYQAMVATMKAEHERIVDENIMLQQVRVKQQHSQA